MLIRETLKILMTFVTTVFCQQSPTIIFISPDQQKNIGDNIEMTCTTQFSNSYPVLWMKLPDTIISNSADRLIPDTRFSLRHDAGSTGYTLTIKDAQENDSGIYQCQISVSNTYKVVKNMQLGVRSGPIITEDTSRDASYSVGADVSLYCNARGSPEPSINWYRENKAILPTGGQNFRGKTLKIFHIKKEDRGTYVCVAENPAGVSKRNIAIQVEFKPEIRIRSKGVGAAIGGFAELECYIEGYPQPRIEWLLDGHLLTNDQHIYIETVGNGQSGGTSKLRISNVENKFYGHYQCKVYNKLGSETGEILVYNPQQSGDAPRAAPSKYRSQTSSASTVFIPFSICMVLLTVLV